MKFSNHKTLLLLTLTSARFIGSAAECIETTDVYDDVCSFAGDRTTCGFLPGCNWSGGACVGAACARHKNENSCNNEMGCFWVDGVLADNVDNVGDYFSPETEDEMDFDHDDMSDWGDIDDYWPGDTGNIGNEFGPGGPSLWSSTTEESTKEYRVNLAVKTILFTLLAIVCLVGVVMISKKSKEGDSEVNVNAKEGGSEKTPKQTNAEDDGQDMTIEHDEEEGHSWNEINGTPTYEIDSDDE